MLENNVRTILPAAGALGGVASFVLFVVALAAFVFQSSCTQVSGSIINLCSVNAEACPVCSRRSWISPTLLLNVCVIPNRSLHPSHNKIFAGTSHTPLSLSYSRHTYCISSYLRTRPCTRIPFPYDKLSMYEWCYARPILMKAADP